MLDAAGAIHEDVTLAVTGFGGHFAIVSGRGTLATERVDGPLGILVAVTGTAYSRRATEIALALAQASGGAVTALYVEPGNALRQWRDTFGAARGGLRPGAAVLQEAVELGRHYSVEVKTQVKYDVDAARALIGTLRNSSYALLVMGVTARSDNAIFFGAVPATVLARSSKSLLLVAT